MEYKASDFDGSWNNEPAGISSEHFNDERRHIFDKQLAALCLNIAGIDLSERDFKALRSAVMNGSINMHMYKSHLANVGGEGREVSDKSAVAKVIKSFKTGVSVELLSHECGHISPQTDFLLSPEVVASFTTIEDYQKFVAAYLLLTCKVMGPPDSKTYTGGKVVDGRKFKIPQTIKDHVRLSAVRFLEALALMAELKAERAKATAQTASPLSGPELFHLQSAPAGPTGPGYMDCVFDILRKGSREGQLADFGPPGVSGVPYRPDPMTGYLTRGEETVFCESIAELQQTIHSQPRTFRQGLGPAHKTALTTYFGLPPNTGSGAGGGCSGDKKA